MDSGSVRWATEIDVAELVRLRRVMFESMGVAVAAADDEAAALVLRTGLANDDFFAAVVDGDGFLAACGIGMTALRVPGPGNPSGRWGYIQSMVTDERCRRRGLGLAVLDALLDRFAELGVVKVDLHATAAGEPLYRSKGFSPGAQVELRWSAQPPNACE